MLFIGVHAGVVITENHTAEFARWQEGRSWSARILRAWIAAILAAARFQRAMRTISYSGGTQDACARYFSLAARKASTTWRSLDWKEREGASNQRHSRLPVVRCAMLSCSCGACE